MVRSLPFVLAVWNIVAIMFVGFIPEVVEIDGKIITEPWWSDPAEATLRRCGAARSGWPDGRRFRPSVCLRHRACPLTKNNTEARSTRGRTEATG